MHQLGYSHSDLKIRIQLYKNIARYNLINTRYIPSDGIPITIRWRSDQFQPAIFWNPWSNKSEWWLPEGDNPWNLLFSSQIPSKNCMAYFVLFIDFSTYFSGAKSPFHLFKQSTIFMRSWYFCRFKLMCWGGIQKFKMKHTKMLLWFLHSVDYKTCQSFFITWKC